MEHLRRSFAQAWLGYVAGGSPEPDVPDTIWVAENHHRYRVAQMQQDYRSLLCGGTPVEELPGFGAEGRHVQRRHHLFSPGGYPLAGVDLQRPRYQRQAQREASLSILRQGVRATAPVVHVFPEGLGRGIGSGGRQELGPQPDVRFSGDFGSVSSIHCAEGGHPPIRTAPRQARSGGADDRGFGHGRGARSVSNPGGLSVPGTSTWYTTDAGS